jgi:hypothetical protein
MLRHICFRPIICLVLVAVSSWLGAQELPSAKKTIHLDRVVAGSPTDFLEVRHVVLKGTNEEIGRALVTIGNYLEFHLKTRDKTAP